MNKISFLSQSLFLIIMQRLKKNQMENNSWMTCSTTEQVLFHRCKKMEKWFTLEENDALASKAEKLLFFFFDDFFQHRSGGGAETLGKLMARCTATMRGRRSFPGNPEEISKRGATHESSGQMVPFPGSPRA